MRRRMMFGFLATLLMVSMLALAFNTQKAKAEPKTIRVPADYPTIQAAIYAASPGDTVFVYNGTYYESLAITKALSLIGEDKDTAIIDGSRNGEHGVIDIKADDVLVSGFTIQNGWHHNIMIWSNSSQITGNRILNNTWMGGIFVQYGANNIIQNNVFSNNDHAIYLYGSTNSVANNSFTNNSLGIYVSARANIIVENTLSNNHEGMHFSWNSVDNNVSNNLITDNEFGSPLRMLWQKHNEKKHDDWQQA